MLRLAYAYAALATVLILHQKCDAQAVGRCESYTDTFPEGKCAALIEYDVFMTGTENQDPEYVTMEDLETEIENYLLLAMPQIFVEECKGDFLKFICGLVFKPCYEIADIVLPRQTCQLFCNELGTQACNIIITPARLYQRNGSPIVPVPEVNDANECTIDTFGGTAPFSLPPPEGDNSWFVTAYPFLEGFRDQPVFPVESSVYTNPTTGITVDVPCFDIRNFTSGCVEVAQQSCGFGLPVDNPYLDEFQICMDGRCDTAAEEECGIKICPDYVVDSYGITKCSMACFQNCPSNLYQAEDYDMMWRAYVIPATLSIPLNIYIFGSYHLGRKTIHKKARPMLKIASFFALLWAVVDVLPSLVLFTDMTCQGDLYINYGRGLACESLRGSIHILQCMYYWVAAAILDLYLAVVKEQIVAKRDDVLKIVRTICYGAPALMCILTYSLQVRDPDYLESTKDGVNKYGVEVVWPNRVWNQYRDQFSCSPYLLDIWTEFVVVYLHFIVCGFMIVSLLCALVAHIFRGSLKGLKSDEKLTLGTINKMLDKTRSKKLIYLGLISTVLLLLNVVVVAIVFPKFQMFDEQLATYTACTYTIDISFKGDPCVDDKSCCDPISPFTLGSAPDPTILAAGYYFAVSAIPLVFGLLFCSDPNHKKTWRRQLGLKSASIGTSAGSTARSEKSTVS